MRKDQLTISYAALGLLPSIPLPTGASSSTTHRAPINLPSSSSTGNEDEVTPKVSYGRIIRDDQGNVIDIILDEEEDQGGKDGEGEVEGALNPVKEWVPEKVEAKTDVVRCESFLLFPPRLILDPLLSYHTYLGVSELLFGNEK
jgi:nucleolar protein 16